MPLRFKYNGITVALTTGSSSDTFALGAARSVGPSRSDNNIDGFAVHVFEV